MRDCLASRIGFILLSAGCAIGIGNVWRFPYVVGQSGGGWFLPIYLLSLLLLGIPVMVMEFAVGRASRRSLAAAHKVLTPDRKIWRVHGVAGLLGNTLLMMFYTSVTGWMIIYFWKIAFGTFAGMEPSAIGAVFVSVLGDPWLQIWHMIGVVIMAAVVCGVGLQNGLERVVKYMMLALLLLIVVLAVNSLRLDGAIRGLEFYLMPDFTRMRSAGIANVIVNAMNHAFFTLSLGIGAMAIFGSYIDKRRTLFGEAINVAVLDTVVAISAGLVIFPACFAYGVEVNQGPSLVFVTLPNVFNHMPWGRFWGALFFVFMSCAALSTVFAVFETIAASIIEYFGWTRQRACTVVAIGLLLLSLPCILGFNVWSEFRPFGEGSSVLDLEDFLVSDLLLPIGALAFAVYCCHKFGWGWKRFVEEANTGDGIKFPYCMRLYCAYVVPLIIFSIFVLALTRRFT